MRKILTAKGGRVLIAILGSGLLLTLALVAVALARPATQLTGPVPTQINYQGYLTDDNGVPITDTLTFTFTLYADSGGTTQLWQEQQNVDVVNGYFSVLLGQVEPLQPADFDGSTRYLGVQPEGAPEMTPRQPIVSVPYALAATHAMTASFALKTEGYDHVIVVAKSGGDYITIDDALDSVTDNGPDSRYLVWVAPGTYSETVTMKPYVHLQGAGQEVTVITSTVSSDSWPPTQATLVLAAHTSLRDLTVGNSGSGNYSIALLATTGVTDTLVTNVTARATGSVWNHGLYNNQGAAVTLRDSSFTARGGDSAYGITSRYSAVLEAWDVTALGEGGTEGHGLYNTNGATAILRGGSFTGRGSLSSVGIYNSYDNATLIANNVTALAEGGSFISAGLLNAQDAAATLQGGSFTGCDGSQAYGISIGNNTTLDAESVTALGETSGARSYGLHSIGTATLQGGTFTGRGGTVDAHGILNSGGTLAAVGVTALGENGTTGNYGLHNQDGATVTLQGGSFTGRGGVYAYGIYNYFSASTLDVTSVTVLGEEATGSNYGLYNSLSTIATLRGGAFTARDGNDARGIYNDYNARLEAESVTVLAENASQYNYGLHNTHVATATLRGGSFTGRGGTADARGIFNYDDDTLLIAENVAVLAEEGANNYGLYNDGGPVAMLRGGTYTAHGGDGAYGIYNHDRGALEAEGVTVLADQATAVALYNYGDSTAMLQGGTYTAHGGGGASAHGIYNFDRSALEAEHVTVLAKDGATSNNGLYNEGDTPFDPSTALLRGGSFTGRGGTHAAGILTIGSATMLTAEGVTALAEGASTRNRGLDNEVPGNTTTLRRVTSIGGGTSGTRVGLYVGAGTLTADSSQFVGATYALQQDSGTVLLAVSLVDGGITRTLGTLTCFQVYDENYAAYICP